MASKIEEQRASRISATKRLPKVNTSMASKLVSKAAPSADDEKNSKKKKKKNAIETWEDVTPENPLGDSRFTDLFKDADFQVDETSHEYKIHHPTEVRLSVYLRNFS